MGRMLYHPMNHSDKPGSDRVRKCGHDQGWVKAKQLTGDVVRRFKKMSENPQPDTKDHLPSVKVFMAKKEGAVKAYCHLTVRVEGIGKMAINGIKVIEGKKGRFVSMPSVKMGEEYKDIVFPVTKESYAAVQKLVLEAYEAFMISAGHGQAPTAGPEEEVPF